MGVPFSQRKDKIMAYIQPNSVVQLFQGINLDNRYLHTIYFSGAGAQDTWFSGKVYRTYQNMSYLRYGVNQIKVKDEASELIECTYMRFQNNRTGDKWFYAFINNVEYLNENTALITYEIDVMQTWFIQGGSVRPCLVRREHVNNDQFGLNLEAEPIGSDIYDSDEILDGSNKIFGDAFSEYSIIAQTTGASTTDEHIVQGLFTGCKYYTHDADTAGDGNTIFNDIQQMLGSWSLQQQQENVIDLYTVPKFCAGNNTGHKTSGSLITIPSAYDNYTPKNKKLFMYPYSYLLVSTHTGDTAIFRWEYFDGTTGSACQFELEGTMIGGGEVRCYPRAYNGQEHNVDSGLVMNNFPKNCALYDAYQAWIASGGSTRLDNDRMVSSFKGAGAVISSLGGLISGLMPSGGSTVKEYSGSESGTFMGQPYANQSSSRTVTSHTGSASIGSTSGGVSGLVGTIGSLIEAKNNIQYTFNDAVYQPNIVVGKPTCSLPVALRDANIYFFHTHIRDDEAKRLDDFFSCYGYAINKVKAPNLTGRQNWNFVMTENAVIAGDMPATSKEAIGRIFDSGITFWHNGDNIGNYAVSTSNGSIDNPII